MDTEEQILGRERRIGMGHGCTLYKRGGRGHRRVMLKRQPEMVRPTLFSISPLPRIVIAHNDAAQHTALSGSPMYTDVALDAPRRRLSAEADPLDGGGGGGQVPLSCCCIWDPFLPSFTQA